MLRLRFVKPSKQAVEAATEAVQKAEGEVEFAKAMEPGVEKRKGKAKAVGDQWRVKYAYS